MLVDEMKKTEISTTIYEAGWKPSQLVSVLQNMKIKQADKRRVSDVINLKRVIPGIQEGLSIIVDIDGEILFGDKYWRNLYKDTDKCPLCGKSEKD